MGSTTWRKSERCVPAVAGTNAFVYAQAIVMQPDCAKDEQMQLPESTAFRLRTQLDCLSTILPGSLDEVLERRPIPEKWCPREILAHLARYQNLFLSRIHRIKTESNPLLSRYRAEDDPEWKSWIRLDSSEIFQILRTQRATLVQQVECMTTEDLARTATHPRFGEMTLLQWIEFFLLHEAHHLLTVLQRSREPIDSD